MTDLGRWLERERITQEEFAARIGAHQTQVSRYVTGARKPSRRIRGVIEVATGGAVTARSWGRRRAVA
jgi:DNA-binding transcriptional regulator YdaS (Cro superfamily)